MTEQQLLERLYELLQAEAAARGDEVDRIDLFSAPDIEVYPVGRSGVIAFIGGYALTGWEPADMRRAARDAYRILGDKLLRDGQTNHMVHHRNVPSTILIRKLGGEFLGYDSDGYFHYRLTLEGYRKAQATHLKRGVTHGKEVSTTESA